MAKICVAYFMDDPKRKHPIKRLKRCRNTLYHSKQPALLLQNRQFLLFTRQKAKSGKGVSVVKVVNIILNSDATKMKSLVREKFQSKYSLNFS